MEHLYQKSRTAIGTRETVKELIPDTVLSLKVLKINTQLTVSAPACALHRRPRKGKRSALAAKAILFGNGNDFISGEISESNSYRRRCRDLNV